MLVFDPDRFAVGGGIGTVRIIPGRPLSEFGEVRGLKLDPREDPFPILCLSVEDLGEAVDALLGGAKGGVRSGVGVRQRIIRREFPGPLWRAEGGKRPRVYTLPEAEAVFTYIQAIYNRAMLGKPGLEVAKRTMLEQIIAARHQLQENPE